MRPKFAYKLRVIPIKKKNSNMTSDRRDYTALVESVSISGLHVAHTFTSHSNLYIKRESSLLLPWNFANIQR